MRNGPESHLGEALMCSRLMDTREPSLQREAWQLPGASAFAVLIRQTQLPRLSVVSRLSLYLIIRCGSYA
jgi:hypothetical protein